MFYCVRLASSIYCSLTFRNWEHGCLAGLSVKTTMVMRAQQSVLFFCLRTQKNPFHLAEYNRGQAPGTRRSEKSSPGEMLHPPTSRRVRPGQAPSVSVRQAESFPSWANAHGGAWVGPVGHALLDRGYARSCLPSQRNNPFGHGLQLQYIYACGTETKGHSTQL